MSLPASLPLALYRGDTYRFQVRLWADAAKTIPVDLTGVVPSAEIRIAPGGTPIVTLSCSVTGNTIDLVLTAAASRQLPVAGAWDLQLLYPSGDVQTIVAGEVTTRGDITGSSDVLGLLATSSTPELTHG